VNPNTGHRDITPGAGDEREMLDDLVPVLYEELRSAARRQLSAARREQAGTPTLATTALVNEAYLKLSDQTRAKWRDRPHFLGIAAVAMRHILVDRARARAAAKRGPGLRVTLDGDVLSIDEEADVVLEIDTALDDLERLNPRLSRVVELRFFGGLSEDEAAESLGVHVRTVQRDWVKARALLRQSLEALGSNGTSWSAVRRR
jgi:RNA polymerase sigma factor (TIGR02999 family)